MMDEINEYVRCSNCGHLTNIGKSRFCENCGAELM